MTDSWSKFEDKVRNVASYIWGGKCEPQSIGGVDVDAVLILGQDAQIFIEITEERSLQKVREDVIKLITARNAYLAEHHSMPRCYCVVDADSITTGMLEAGKSQNIQVMSFNEFSNIFFNFDNYRTSREVAAFSSAVNPVTGEKDQQSYVPVTYLVDGSSRETKIGDIAGLVRDGHKVVLLGEYGTGKSRCFKEVFKLLSESARNSQLYPIAIDLRDGWGLKRASELIQRHVSELGLDSSLEKSAIRALNAHRTLFLLDGFDELGSQSWSNDNEKLRAIRASSLQGVRDLIQRNGSGGILVSGREHYFNSNFEMLAALGLSGDKTIILRSKTEFSQAEMEEFFRVASIEVALPEWLPRRPLICRTIADLSEEDLDEIFGVGRNELQFWDHFIDILCSRDARISQSFDSSTIKRVLQRLARQTRSKSANVGPISLAEVQRAFEAIVGQMPVDEASVMLQRLPGLGRVKSESNERQFVDTYILDGLRAKDVAELLSAPAKDSSDVLDTTFLNPLEVLGQRILGKELEGRTKLGLDLAKRSCNSKNRVIASDVAAAILETSLTECDFGGITISEGNFMQLDFSKTIARNLHIEESIFGTLILPALTPPNTSIKNSLAQKVIGISSPSGLPDWIAQLSAEKFDSVESISRIRKLDLSPPEEILVTIIRKTFFQKGAGRMEEALLRGLGQVASAATASGILNYLIKEGILTKFPGKEGYVYSPVRKEAGRMKRMLNELRTSGDPVWLKMAEF